MKQRLKLFLKLNSLRGKIGFSSGLGILIIAISFTTYSAINTRKQAIEYARVELQLAAENYLLELKSRITEAEVMANKMKRILEISMLSTPPKLSRQQISEYMVEITKKEKGLLLSAIMFLPNAYDDLDTKYKGAPMHDSTGIFSIRSAPDSTGKIFASFVLIAHTQGMKQFVMGIKNVAGSLSLPPTRGGNKKEFVVAIGVPIYNKNNDFAGISAGFYRVDSISTLAQKTKQHLWDNKAEVSLISQNGYYLANTYQPDYIRQNINDLFPKDVAAAKIQQVLAGETFIGIEHDTMRIRLPFKVVANDANWQLEISVPLQVVLAQANYKMWWQIIIGLGITFITIGLMIIFLSKLTRPLTHLVTQIKQLAHGNLNVTFDHNIRSNDELDDLAKSFNQMTDKLRVIVTEIRQGAQNVSNAGEELTMAAQRVSAGASQQAASTEEVSTSIEEMSASINQNTENASQTRNIALQSQQSMITIKQAANKMAESMQDIITKISIINEIADRTDLLAINAAVEAARAGEHGKGFAVVAGEVRKLAEKSQQSAEKVNTVSQSGIKLAKEVTILMNNMIPDVENPTALIQEITASSIEQNTGIAQINNALQQLSVITEQNATTAEQVAASAEELAGQAMQLTEIIAFFDNQKQTGNEPEDITKIKLRIAQLQTLLSEKEQEQNNITNETQKQELASPTIKKKINKGIELKLNEDLDEEFEKF